MTVQNSLKLTLRINNPSKLSYYVLSQFIKKIDIDNNINMKMEISE